MSFARVSVLGVLAIFLFGNAACGRLEDRSVEAPGSALTAAQCDHFDVAGKVQICHATGSSKHPYTILKVSERACVNAHVNHPGDYVSVGDPLCGGGGCLPAGAPCDATVPCCDGLSCTAGTCAGPPPPCAATGGQVCLLPNTLFTCAAGTLCEHPVCAGGFANCDRQSPDCETPIGSAAGGCFPTYLGTYAPPTLYGHTKAAVGADGATYLAGTFSQTTDFDPGSGVDLRTPQGPSGVFLVKLNPAGTYAWTVTWGGADSSALPSGLGVSSTAIVLVGSFQNDLDLDPGPGTLVATSPLGGSSSFVVSLNLDGGLGWANTLQGTSSCAAEGLALSSSGDLYLAGSYTGLCDLDPGPGVDAPPAAANVMQGFVLKLNGVDGVRLWSTLLVEPVYAARAATVSATGDVWVAGDYVSGTMHAAVISSLTPAGAVRFVRELSPDAQSGLGAYGIVAAGADGSIYVGGDGGGGGVIDFDPGAGSISRVLSADSNTSGTFVLKLAGDGTFRWVQTLWDLSFVGLAARGDGGVVVTTSPMVSGTPSGTFITKLEGDSTPAWSLLSGGISGVAPNDAAGGASTFVISGGSELGAAADFDPGPAVDTIAGGVTFLSRFTD